MQRATAVAKGPLGGVHQARSTSFDVLLERFFEIAGAPKSIHGLVCNSPQGCRFLSVGLDGGPLVAGGAATPRQAG